MKIKTEKHVLFCARRELLFLLLIGIEKMYLSKPWN